MTRLRCHGCNRREIGQLPDGYSVLWTGVVSSYPGIPDGCLYVQCRCCKEWNRFEITPPNEYKLPIALRAA